VDLIEKIGAFAGFAAFIGLAILTLLYFSQARDVRRLRDWAGRAPERAAGEVAATQHYLPPVPIEQAGKRTRRPLGERIRRIHIPEWRYIALAVGGAVILAGAAFGALQLTGSDEAANSSRTATSDGASRDKSSSGGDARKRRVNIDPSQVTVAVLNGTTIAGLAAQVGEEARADGFTLGTVTNAATTSQSQSEVMYRQGKKDEARAVADRLNIRTIVPVNTLNAELAGSFDVVVLVGSDRGG
jgi:hypothetical protein